MKKSKKIIISVLCTLLTLWLCMFITDFVRAGTLREPVFAFSSTTTASDTGSDIYRGLGYKVSVEKYIDENLQISISSVEISVFGKIISASIT